MWQQLSHEVQALVTSTLSFKLVHDSSACLGTHLWARSGARLPPNTLVDTSFEELAPGYSLLLAVIMETAIEGARPY